MFDVPFSFSLANATLATQRIQFELQFNSLQNSLISRFNDEVQDITETPRSLQREIDTLAARSERLVNSLEPVQNFRQGIINTQGALATVFDEITTLFNTFNQDATVSAEEVAAFEAQREVVADKIESLYVFSHPDINNTGTIQRLKDDVSDIRALTLTVGNLTPDNDATTEALSSLQSETSTAITVMGNLNSTALDFEQRIQSDFLQTDSQILCITSEETDRREVEVANAEAELGNLLRVISISFEVGSGLAQTITNNLRPATPPAGSIVNIFS